MLTFLMALCAIGVTGLAPTIAHETHTFAPLVVIPLVWLTLVCCAVIDSEG